MELQLQLFKLAQGELYRLREQIKAGRPEGMSDDLWVTLKMERLQLTVYVRTLKRRLDLIELEAE
ncbi:hypothetical protein [Acinetobacter sp. A47]|uniref:hypothetical protein n=1 Tax=Acinetobacter sp. A47 TaxID=1561217 RepID=UPI000571C522|nr:hypothetical protein [Acinetobacter sp. A47]